MTDARGTSRKVRRTIVETIGDFRATNPKTGEILECKSLVTLLQCIARDLAHLGGPTWTVEEVR